MLCYNELYNFFKILSDKNRFRIFCLILKRNRVCVCDIIQYTGLKKNLVSHHLKILKESGLVISRKKGLNVYYQLNEQNLNKILNFIFKKERNDN